MPDKVTSLDDTRAKKFLWNLARNPFIAVVFVEGEVRIYTHGIDPSADNLRKIQDELAQIT